MLKFSEFTHSVKVDLVLPEPRGFSIAILNFHQTEGHVFVSPTHNFQKLLQGKQFWLNLLVKLIDIATLNIHGSTLLTHSRVENWMMIQIFLVLRICKRNHQNIKPYLQIFIRDILLWIFVNWISNSRSEIGGLSESCHWKRWFPLFIMWLISEWRGS